MEHYVASVGTRTREPDETPPVSWPIVLSSGRRRMLVITAFEIALSAAFLTLFAEVAIRSDPDGLHTVQLLFYVVWTAYLIYRQVSSVGYEIVIDRDNVEVRSLLRSRRVPLSVVVEVSNPRFGLRVWPFQRHWRVYYVREGKRRMLWVMTRHDVWTAILSSKELPEHRW